MHPSFLLLLSFRCVCVCVCVQAHMKVHNTILSLSRTRAHRTERREKDEQDEKEEKHEHTKQHTSTQWFGLSSPQLKTTS